MNRIIYIERIRFAPRKKADKFIQLCPNVPFKGHSVSLEEKKANCFQMYYEHTEYV